MPKFLITVGIPFFNAQDTLLEAVRSIFAQTFNEWELILVDDGSTDGSIDIARSIDDPRVRLLPLDGRNLRLAARLNQISQAARGEYISRMDADDLSHPERFSRQLGFLKDHPEVNVLGACVCMFDKNYAPVSKLVVQEHHNEILKNKFDGISIAHPTIMAKAEWFRKWPYDEQNSIRCEDFELWLRSSRQSVFANIGEPLYFYSELISSTLAKYTKSKQSAAKVIWRYAPMEIGLLKASYQVWKKYLDIIIFASAGFTGLRDLAIKKRKSYHSLSPEEHLKLVTALNIIRRTEVPIRSSERKGKEYAIDT